MDNLEIKVKELNATIQNQISEKMQWFILGNWKENWCGNILWILMITMWFLTILHIIFYKKKNSFLSVIVSILLLLVIITIPIFFGILMFKYRRNLHTTIMISSPPSDKKVIRNSIQQFINKAKDKNPQVVPYEDTNTYVYIDDNFYDQLLHTKMVNKSSLLEESLNNLFPKYPYIPIAIIKDGTLKSLMNSDFIHLQK